MANCFEDVAKTTKEIDGENYSKAVQLVKMSGNTSISFVQRQLNLGYNRAARIIETMVSDGILSAPDQSGKRTIVAPNAANKRRVKRVRLNLPC